MPTPPLLDPSDLTGFAGAPFDPAVVAAAAATVRAEAGWHIVPSVTETVAVEGDGSRYLFLPTLHLVSVTAVRDISGETPRDLDGWTTAKTARFVAGCLRRNQPWPCVEIEVDIVHGYDACPADLFPAIATLCQDARVNKATGQVRLGSLSINGTSDAVGADGTSVAAALSRYRVTGQP